MVNVFPTLFNYLCLLFVEVFSYINDLSNNERHNHGHYNTFVSQIFKNIFLFKKKVFVKVKRDLLDSLDINIDVYT